VAEYSFTTVWELDAPIERVWEVILDTERWPEWWRGVERVERLEPGAVDGVGKVDRYVWRSRLPYELSFDMRTVEVRPPVELRGVAVGELAGEGHWRLFRTRPGTIVRYDWNVATTAAWMNLLVPIARAMFEWNHDAVMRNGGEGLARLLGVRLLSG
jgi:Polyketide cyclase / dehydrase and lipid transport